MKQAAPYVTVNFPILGILTVLFIALKLTHVITWPWFWVLAPSWVPALLLAVFLLAFLIGYVVVKATE